MPRPSCKGSRRNDYLTCEALSSYLETEEAGLVAGEAKGKSRCLQHWVTCSADLRQVPATWGLVVILDFQNCFLRCSCPPCRVYVELLFSRHEPKRSLSCMYHLPSLSGQHPGFLNKVYSIVFSYHLTQTYTCSAYYGNTFSPIAKV